MFLFEEIIYFLIGILIHLFPFLVVFSSNRLKQNYFLIVISLIPFCAFLYLIFYGLTCGSGCFSGIFLLFTIVPAFILSAVLLILKLILDRRNKDI